MTPTDLRPAPEPALKLRRRAAAAPDVSENVDTPAGRAAELAALEEREANLRAYEERLRTWQAQLDRQAAGGPPPAYTAAPFQRPSSQAPFARDPALEMAWEKLHRARALLEAERNQLCDERLKLRDATAAVQDREERLADREARLIAREQALAAAPPAAPAPSAAETPAGATAWSLTQAPFRAAKALFRPGN